MMRRCDTTKTEEPGSQQENSSGRCHLDHPSFHSTYHFTVQTTHPGFADSK
jgi:hypothetical protein